VGGAVPAAGIGITVNGEARSAPAGSTIASLVESLGLGGSGGGRVAVERNRQIVPKSRWGEELAEGDVLEIVAFVGGG
jgi:thiamine biosynthesis protein ThiS